jgi:hypothetical protein
VNSLLSASEARAIAAINRWHKAAVSAGDDFMTAAVECGKLLLLEKEDCEHGEWLEWLNTNFDGTPRTAQRFMRIANATAASHLPMNGSNLTEALASIATPKQEKPPAKPDLVISPRKRATDEKPKTPSSRLADSVVIDAEIMEPSPAPPPSPQDDEPETLVVDGTKAETPPVRKSGWSIGHDFIKSLKGYSPAQERGAICDVLQYCQARLAELDQLAETEGTK